MRKNYLAPIFAVICGAIGAFLRKTELNTTFDPVSGLQDKNAVVTVALIALTAFVSIIFILFSRAASKGLTVPAEYEKAFYTKSKLSVCLSMACGAVIAAASVLLFMEGSADRMYGTAFKIFCAFGFGTGLSVIFMALKSHGKDGKGAGYIASVLPALFYCFYMAFTYRVYANSPVLAVYAWDCAAFALAALSFYFTAGFCYGRVNALWTLFTHIMSVFLLTVILADERVMALKIIIGATTVFILQNSVRLLNALSDLRESSQIQKK